MRGTIMEKDRTNRLSRHQFLKIVAGGAIAAALPRVARAQPPGPTTHVYKTVGQCQIKADVYHSAAAPSRPCSGSTAAP